LIPFDDETTLFEPPKLRSWFDSAVEVTLTLFGPPAVPSQTGRSELTTSACGPLPSCVFQ
jgi:hypothetical protein